MASAISIIGAAHMHALGYSHAIARHADAAIVSVWDQNAERGVRFAQSIGAEFLADRAQAIASCDAAIVASENVFHIDHLEALHDAGKPVLCEKPIIGLPEQRERLLALIEAGARIMTAFPCRYSAAFQSALVKVRSGAIGKVLAICATNRGRCPFDWFVQPEQSGGGAIIDHVVHVGDLLALLLGQPPVRVTAQSGSNVHGQRWEDTAMLSIEYADGTFATLDASWSRPSNYKTWGDVTLNIVGDKGVVEVDLFGQGFDAYAAEPPGYSSTWFGSDIDAALVDDFVKWSASDAEPRVSAKDGLAAVDIAFEAYRSLSA